MFPEASERNMWGPRNTGVRLVDAPVTKSDQFVLFI